MLKEYVRSFINNIHVFEEILSRIQTRIFYDFVISEHIQWPEYIDAINGYQERIALINVVYNDLIDYIEQIADENDRELLRNKLNEERSDELVQKSNEEIAKMLINDSNAYQFLLDYFNVYATAVFNTIQESFFSDKAFVDDNVKKLRTLKYIIEKITRQINEYTDFDF